ncbi:uncharacterized protein CIMG_07701 [Coccidioides immitis RS]|uniref:BTB domain transcription factor n=2 Tax=Coccidioides immitis TaxID=5501 RepID=J3K3Y1_COCIM|nr:uncharacterized protein CIMG_07701 [Coccidioides immitis RS]EAS28955.3 hypothetical protein CIMG_07701 [Coccidioides immitis RS]KMP06082.1 hypothetical protein CIRG_05763 [Coccidioides immitis RMSCC 2394]TPX22869.1 hypothetical protein DIZ76_014749 [Coccidioides immitis]
MPTRTSTRQAAVKANEALHQTARAATRRASGSKRKGSTDEGGAKVKRGKKVGDEPHAKEEAIPADQQPSQPPKDQLKKAEKQQNGHDINGDKKKASSEGKGLQKETKEEGKGGAATQPETAVRRSVDREEEIPSNVLEKGIIYFFFRSRVGVEEPESLEDIARSFIVLRPLPLGAELGKGPIGDDPNCRLLVLPKKQLPSSPRERYMGFVEKANSTLKTIRESFLGTEYETKTQGHQEVPSATPLAEGVYAITSTTRSSHLAYILTIPGEPSEIQTDFGLKKKASFVVSSKSPKFPGPSMARLPKPPEYPQEILDGFRDLRWVPLEPKFINYPNAQFLMIGEARGELGKGGMTENKPSEKVEAGEELEQLEHENEVRASPLRDDHAVFEDLGMSSKQFSSMPTTWE